MHQSGIPILCPLFCEKVKPQLYNIGTEQLGCGAPNGYSVCYFSEKLENIVVFDLYLVLVCEFKSLVNLLQFLSAGMWSTFYVKIN